ncbi:bzip transcription factor 68 [Anaeramoeba flamelloides]|uniref:Bzip transcription factor 68 n=1 Tax=Anaeramoeba flamelloides TaxID=1746091 RepID=A0ABQ8YBG3_9EUKA|nr:bzip transcription factor 68 [Anaeramoeba flamelloides]
MSIKTNKNKSNTCSKKSQQQKPKKNCNKSEEKTKSKNSLQVTNERKRKQTPQEEETNEDEEEEPDEINHNQLNQKNEGKKDQNEEEIKKVEQKYKRARLILTRVVKKKKIKIEKLSPKQVEKIQKKRNRRNARRFRKRKQFYQKELEEESKNLKITNKCIQTELDEINNENSLLRIEVQKLKEQLKEEYQDQGQSQQETNKQSEIKQTKQKDNFHLHLGDDYPNVVLEDIFDPNTLEVDQNLTNSNTTKMKNQRSKKTNSNSIHNIPIPNKKTINSNPKTKKVKITSPKQPTTKFSEIDNLKTNNIPQKEQSKNNDDLKYFDQKQNCNNSFMDEELDLFSFSKFENVDQSLYDDFLLKNFEEDGGGDHQWL